MTQFFPRVAIMNPTGERIRHIPGEMARTLVANGVLVARPTSGRIRETVLALPATSHAQRIGEPSTPSLAGVRFTRWRRLDESASRIIEHHPRALWVL